MVQQNRRPHSSESFGERFFSNFSRLLLNLQRSTAVSPPVSPGDSPASGHVASDAATVPSSDEAVTPPAEITAQPTPTLGRSPAIADASPQYEWKVQGRYPTAKDAFAVATPLADTSQVVGYPALANPEAQLKLYQVKNSSDPFDQTDLARLLPPGEIAIVACAYYPDLRHNEIPFKRNVGHASLAVGVERAVEQQVDGQTASVKQQGVMTINNPQSYLGGSFKGGGYGSFFIQRLKFPAEITLAEKAAYEKNIVTMTALANTYIPFAQENFNGSDPLGIHNEARIREAGENLILAVYGDEAAKEWLRESRNTAYCAELVSAGVNTGTTTILSKAYIEALRQKLAVRHGEDRYLDLYEKVSDRINSKSFLAENANKNFQYVDCIGMVDENINLQPINQRCPQADQSGTGLAFMYYDFADIAYSSIRDTYPRKELEGLTGLELDAAQKYNAQVAQVQISAFEQAATKFKGLANLVAAVEVAFNLYVDEVVKALGRVYPSSSEREQVMLNLVQKGRQFTPTGPNGEGMFIPPDLYLMPTSGWADLENMGICFFPENLKAIG